MCTEMRVRCRNRSGRSECDQASPLSLMPDKPVVIAAPTASTGVTSRRPIPRLPAPASEPSWSQSEWWPKSRRLRSASCKPRLLASGKRLPTPLARLLRNPKPGDDFLSIMGQLPMTLGKRPYRCSAWCDHRKWSWSTSMWSRFAPR